MKASGIVDGILKGIFCRKFFATLFLCLGTCISAYSYNGTYDAGIVDYSYDGTTYTYLIEVSNLRSALGISSASGGIMISLPEEFGGEQNGESIFYITVSYNSLMLPDPQSSSGDSFILNIGATSWLDEGDNTRHNERPLTIIATCKLPFYIKNTKESNTNDITIIAGEEVSYISYMGASPTPSNWSEGTNNASSIVFPADTPGKYTLTATSVVNNAEQSCTVTVIGVGYLECEGVVSATDSPGEMETVYLEYSSGKVLVTAYPDPEDETFPELEWSPDTTDQSGNTARIIPEPAGDLGAVTATCGKSSKSLNYVAVSIKSLSGGGVSSTTNTPSEAETIYVAVGSDAITLTAAPDPDSASWPKNRPEWTNATSSGTSGEATFNPSSASSDSNGTTVSATCGETKSVKIVVVGLSGIYLNGDKSTDYDKKTYYLALGDSVNVSTDISPSNANHPDNEPTWSGVDDGNPGDMDVTYNSSEVSSSTDGTEVKAVCGTDSKAVNIVTVGVSELDVDGEWYDDSNYKYYEAVGESITITAIADPENATWPDGNPTWDGASGSEGNAAEATYCSNTVSSDTSGTSVKASCGTSSSSMSVVTVGIKGLEIDETDYKDKTYFAKINDIIFIEASTDPEGAEWPSNYKWPEWSVDGETESDYTGYGYYYDYFEESGLYEIKASCGDSEASMNVCIMDLSLDVQNLDDDSKESVGAFVPLTTGSNSVRIPVTLTVNPSSLPSGYTGALSMTVSSGISVWDSASGGNNISSETWTLGSENSYPSNIYIQGDTVSGSLRDNSLNITLTITEDSTGTEIQTLEDQVNVTVFNVKLNVDGVSEDEKTDPGALFKLKDIKTITLDSEPSGVLSAMNGAGLSGTLTLTKTESGTGKLSLWKDSGCGTEASTLSWDFSQDNDFQETLYGLGDTGSSSGQDINLELKLTLAGTELSDSVNATVVNVDLESQNQTLTQAQKTSVGMFMPLDSDGNTKLEPVTISLAPISVPEGYTGKVKLTATDNIYVWSDENRTEELTDKEWDLSSETVPDTVYVEGYTSSNSLRSDYITLTLTLYPAGSSAASVEASDTINITVFKVNIDIDSLTDEQKEDPGVFIGVNKAKTLKLSSTPSDVLPELQSQQKGVLKLSEANSGGKLKFWKDKTMLLEITNLSWDFSDSSNDFQETIYVSGTEESDDYQDTEIDLELNVNDVSSTDSVTATVVNINLDIYQPDGSKVNDSDEDNAVATMSINDDYNDATNEDYDEDSSITDDTEVKKMCKLVLRQINTENLPDGCAVYLSASSELNSAVKVFMLDSPDSDPTTGTLILDTENGLSTVTAIVAAKIFEQAQDDDVVFYMEGCEAGIEAIKASFQVPESTASSSVKSLLASSALKTTLLKGTSTFTATDASTSNTKEVISAENKVTILGCKLDIISPADNTTAVKESVKKTEGEVINVKFYKTDYLKLRINNMGLASDKGKLTLQFQETRFNIYADEALTTKISSGQEFPTNQDTIVYLVGVKPNDKVDTLNTGDTIPADQSVKLVFTPSNGTAAQNDEVRVLVASPIFAVFGDKLDWGSGDLSTYISSNQKDTRTNNPVIKGHPENASTDLYYSVTILRSKDEMQKAFTINNADIVFAGHSNFGIGFAFDSNYTSISQFWQVGKSYVDVDFTYLHDHQQTGLKIVASDIINYNKTGVDKYSAWGKQASFSFNHVNGSVNYQEFYASITPGCTSYVLKRPDDFSLAYHYKSSGDKHIVFNGNKPGNLNLKYRKLFLDSCNSGVYYANNFKQGTLFYTTNLAHPGAGAPKKFIEVLIEGKNNNEILSELNNIESVHDYR